MRCRPRRGISLSLEGFCTVPWAHGAPHPPSKRGILLIPVACPPSCRFSLQNATCVGASWRGSSHWTHLKRSGSWDVPSPLTWSNCTACLCWTLSCVCILVFRLMSSLTTHTGQPTELQGRPGDLLWLLDEPSPRKPRNTCVSVLQTKRKRSSRPIRNWR